MVHKPAHWEATEISWKEVSVSASLGQVAGWTFFEHPTLGDGATVLAVSLDRIGENGPIVFDTLDYDIPEYF